MRFRAPAKLVGWILALKWVNRPESLAAAAPDVLNYGITAVIRTHTKSTRRSAHVCAKLVPMSKRYDYDVFYEVDAIY